MQRTPLKTPVKDPAAIVTGGLRGLGKAMAFGMAREGVRVIAVGHIEEDVRDVRGEAAAEGLADRIHPMVADLRDPGACDLVIETCRTKFGGLHILVNNAGLTFTYIWPKFSRSAPPPKFWEVTDEITRTVMDTNYVAADQMTRRVAPLLVNQGWGRIINVTTLLQTMTLPHSIPYGASKAALEMATHVWAKHFPGTGVTLNILNPGSGAYTPGVAEEVREFARNSDAVRFIEPEEMVPPLLWLLSEEAAMVNGYRFDAFNWDTSVAPSEAARANGRPAGFTLLPQDESKWPAPGGSTG